MTDLIQKVSFLTWPLLPPHSHPTSVAASTSPCPPSNPLPALLYSQRLNDKCLARALSQSQKRGAAGVQPSRKTTIIELSGTDRPGLLSEISAVLTSQQCNVDAAECWTHRTRVACVAYVTDQATRGAILDQEKLRVIKELLSNVMRSDGGDTSGRFVTDFLIDDTTHSQRRMHQLLYDDRDYEINVVGGATCDVQVRRECGYSVVNIVCKDRPKLLFDTVCTLTDMGFVVFHATIDTDNGEAVQVKLLSPRACSAHLELVLLRSEPLEAER